MAAETSPAPGLGKLPCDWQPPVGDRLDVSCPLEASGTTQRFRFKANFSGGHDDTMASMTPALDGSPLVCDEGSKTDLFGEDGDVSLECRFSMTEKAGTKHVLGVKLKWSHAQYTDFQFGSD
ncbi:MAG: hypothetical protein ACT4PZ_07240 [Panacagrimonas sp.]